MVYCCASSLTSAQTRLAARVNVPVQALLNMDRYGGLARVASDEEQVAQHMVSGIDVDVCAGRPKHVRTLYVSSLLLFLTVHKPPPTFQRG